MIELDSVPDLDSPVAIVAFEGWNDAADAATGLIDHLIEQWDARQIGELDPDDFYDFQVNRPMVDTNEHGHRVITWPAVTIHLARPRELGRDVLLIKGPEPSMRWRQFCAELLSVLDRTETELVITLGALMADSPHSRPLPVTGSATEPELLDRLRIESSNYEGPTGIVGIFNDSCALLDIPTVSYWVAVPHYVAQPPSPKASLALLTSIEDVLESPLPIGELAENARAWERGVDDVAGDDEDIADYIRSLEESRDTASLPEASGEAIAKAFERYLKRRDDT